jgi:UTP:GlnB (protein PII) uridylyltransferase
MLWSWQCSAWPCRAASTAVATAATLLHGHGHLRCSRSVETVISIQHNEESAFSTLHIKTLDRPGLLVEIVKVLKDINVNVISAEVH